MNVLGLHHIAGYSEGVYCRIGPLVLFVTIKSTPSYHSCSPIKAAVVVLVCSRNGEMAEARNVRLPYTSQEQVHHYFSFIHQKVELPC